METTAQGEPAAVLWQGRLLPVAAIADRWRIDDEWWRNEISRRYYAIHLAGGARLVIYRDLVSGAWHVQPYSSPQRERPGGGRSR